MLQGEAKSASEASPQRGEVFGGARETYRCNLAIAVSLYPHNRVRGVSLGCALFYKPIWQLTVNERGHYADSEDTVLFKIEDSPDTRLGA